jgi:glucose/arabinose dehydrogenase
MARFDSRTASLLAALMLPALSACGPYAKLSAETGYGGNPALPAPEPETIATYNVPSVKGWKPGETPSPASGLRVNAFAAELEHPRWLYALPNGDILVAESNHNTRWANRMGYGGYLESLVQRIGGLFGKESPNRITLLRDQDGNGVAETKSIFLTGLNEPFGMTLVGGTLYVANTDSLMAYPYAGGETRIVAPGRKIADLPAGAINHHWTKNVIASPDGTKLYVTIGSNSNAGENGMEAEAERARIWEVDPSTGAHRTYAFGIRNPNGMDWKGGTLWTVSNERDRLGGDLVPDYLTSVKEGGFYGWPFSYYGRHVDREVEPQNPQLVARAIAPDYATGAHTATLGLVFSERARLGAKFADGAFITQHGSWNRKPLSGYRVAFVPFTGGAPSGATADVLTGFLNQEGDARGRPAGLAIDKSGALLIADDGGNIVWRVIAAAQ